MSTDPRFAALESLWQRVLDDPSSDEAHQKVINFAAQQDLFAQLAAKYKELDRSAPEISAKYKKVLADRAMAQIFAKNIARKPLNKKRAGLWSSMVFLGFVGLLMSSGQPVSQALSGIAVLSGVGGLILIYARNKV